MVTLARPETDERDALLVFLDSQRGAIRRAVHGLTDEQAATKSTVSALTLSGLLKHVARCEQFWIVGTLMGRPLDWPEAEEWADGHRLTGARPSRAG